MGCRSVDSKSLRITALALSYLAAKYACPDWMSSAHVKKENVAVNETCKIITGCIKPTSINKLHTLWYRPTIVIRLKVVAEEKSIINEKHPLYVTLN